MSDVVTATRQVVQDLLAPELRELKARLGALESKLDDSIKRVDDGFKRVDEKFKNVEENIRDLRGEVAGGFSEIRVQLAKQMDYVELRERIAKVEAQNQVLASRQADDFVRKASSMEAH
jgi:predicted nuclease with TOPRIM domain